MRCKGSVVLQTEGSKQIGVECIHVIEGLPISRGDNISAEYH